MPAGKTIGHEPLNFQKEEVKMKKSIVWPVMSLLLVSGLYACGGGGGSTPAADTAAPSAPAGLNAAAASSTSVACSWQAATDNVGVTGYKVYRNGTQIETTSNTAYTDDIGLISNTTYTYTVAAYDAAGNVSAQSAPARAKTLAASLRVRVVDYAHAPVTGATVVLGNSVGAMLSSGITDVNGEYTFDTPPLNATVTSVQIVTGQSWSYDINIAYDVNSSEVTLGLPLGNSDSNAPGVGPNPIGTLTLNVSNATGTATRNSVFIGNTKYASNTLVTQGTYTVNLSDIQSDNKLSIFAVSYDVNDQPVHYGALLDQICSDGTTTSISVDQPVSFVQYQMTNIPSASMFNEYFFYSRKGVRLPGSAYTYTPLTSATTATSLVHYYLPEVGDDSSYLFTVNDGSLDGITFKGWGTAVFSNQSVDLGHPTIPSNLMVSYATGTATSTLSWSGDASAGVLYGNGNAGASNFYFTAAPSRTSIRFPQLPNSVAGAWPVGIGWFCVQEDIASFLGGYEDFLAKWDLLSSGTWTYPASGVSKTSFGYFGLSILTP